MKRWLSACLAAGLLTGACVSPIPVPGDGTGATPVVSRSLAAISGKVSEARLRADIQRMVGFGTRSTISDQLSSARGIGAARRWAEGQFRNIGSECGNCFEIILPSDTVTGNRYPQPTLVVNVVAIQRGVSDPNRVIIIQAHLDSRNSTNENVTDDAPGANDNASGVAAVLEAARILSKQTFGATIVYAALSGEEQGLSGGTILADYARRQGWQVEAVLNNDIIGNSRSINGKVDDRTVRVFSEGVRATETDEMAAARKVNGGEIDSPSRNLARYLAALAKNHMSDFRVRLIYRRDRYGRGGDQTPFQDAGYPAVRVTESVENWNHQHQNIRTENGTFYGDTIDYVDFAYLARVARLNVMALASLASAPAPPLEVTVEGALSVDTRVRWTPVQGAERYRIWWRDTIEPEWSRSVDVSGAASEFVVKDVVLDDHFFGVQAVSADGYASPVQYAGPLGAFFPRPARR